MKGSHMIELDKYRRKALSEWWIEKNIVGEEDKGRIPVSVKIALGVIFPVVVEYFILMKYKSKI